MTLDFLKDAANAVLIGDVEVYGYLAHEYLRARLMDDARKTVERGWSFVSGATDNTSIHRLATARAMPGSTCFSLWVERSSTAPAWHS